MLTEAMLGPAAAGNVVVGIHWEHPQYSTSQGGRTQTWTTSQLAGCNGFSYGSATMIAGWNDIVSSAKAFANCTDFENYENANWGGTRIDCTQECPALGLMNDKTSAWRLDNVYP